jgi:hypothetical protein
VHPTGRPAAAPQAGPCGRGILARWTPASLASTLQNPPRGTPGSRGSTMRQTIILSAVWHVALIAGLLIVGT